MYIKWNSYEMGENMINVTMHLTFKKKIIINNWGTEILKLMKTTDGKEIVDNCAIIYSTLTQPLRLLLIL